jgi:hypothetical protein
VRTLQRLVLQFGILDKLQGEVSQIDRQHRRRSATPRHATRHVVSSPTKPGHVQQRAREVMRVWCAAPRVVLRWRARRGVWCVCLPSPWGLWGEGGADGALVGLVHALRSEARRARERRRQSERPERCIALELGHGAEGCRGRERRLGC